MSKPVKIFGLVLALLVALVTALVVAAKLFITPERVRETLLAHARETLAREVTLGEIEVGLAGITLKSLSVKDRDGREQFLAAERAVLRYQLAPLLARQVVVDEVRIVKPHFRIVRLADGTLNCNDLLAVPGAAAPQAGKEPAPGGNGGVSLLVARVLVEGGDILFLDQKVKPPLQTDITGISLTVKDIAPNKPFPVTLKATVAGAALEARAETAPGGAISKGTVKLDGLNLAAFAPYLQEAIPGRLNGLKLSLATDVARDAAGTITLKGKVTAADIDVVLDAMKETPVKGLSLGLDHDLAVDPKAAVADLRKAVLTVGGVPVEIAGRVSDYRVKPALDLNVQVRDLDLAKTIAALPAAFVEGVRPLEPTGAVSCKLRLLGDPAEPAKLIESGELQLVKLSVASGGMRPELNGALLLTGNKLSTGNLRVNLGDNTANVNVTVEDVTRKPYRVTLALTSDRFQLEPLLAPAAGGEAAPAADAPEKAKAALPPTEAGPLDLPVTADGSVRIGKASYQGLDIDNFDMHFRLEKNVLTVDKMNGQAAGGSFQNTANIDLGKKGFTYATTVNVNGARAEALLPPFMPETRDAVSGLMDLKADLHGAGTLPERAKKNLGGRGQFVITNGRIATRLSEGLASFLGTQELRVLRFTRFATGFEMKDGVARVTSECTGDDVRLTPNGTVSLVDDAVDLSLGAKLSPELSGRLDRGGKLGPLLADGDGWTLVPLKVAGTLGAPGFTLDTAAVADKVKEKAAGEIRTWLLDKFAPKPSQPTQPSGGAQPAPSEPGKAIQEGLKGLFGR